MTLLDSMPVVDTYSRIIGVAAITATTTSAALDEAPEGVPGSKRADAQPTRRGTRCVVALVTWPVHRDCAVHCALSIVDWLCIGSGTPDCVHAWIGRAPLLLGCHRVIIKWTHIVLGLGCRKKPSDAARMLHAELSTLRVRHAHSLAALFDSQGHCSLF